MLASRGWALLKERIQAYYTNTLTSLASDLTLEETCKARGEANALKQVLLTPAKIIEQGKRNAQKEGRRAIAGDSGGHD